MLWRPGRIFIPQGAFSGWMGGATTVRVGLGAGAPVEQEVGALGYCGALFDTAGDELAHVMALPEDLDVAQPLFVRCHFITNSATAADTVDWKVLYTPVTPNVTTSIDPVTALTTPIAQMAVLGTAAAYQTSPWGIIKGGVISEKAEILIFKCELDAFAVGLTEDKFFMGAEFRYTPKRLQGPDGMGISARPTLAMLGKAY